MNGVDVLAAMDRAKRVLQLCDPFARSRMLPEMNSVEAQAFNARAEMEEARAAVAELIEAGTELQLANEDLVDRKTGNVGERLKRLHKAESRFVSALSRVRGAE